MTPIYDSDSLDWALGELVELFERANSFGIYPHELDPAVFYDAWLLLSEQPFPVAQRWHALLLAKITRPLRPLASAPMRKRYAYVQPH
jgi:hypothetical protein